jgi:hypothetical protein
LHITPTKIWHLKIIPLHQIRHAFIAYGQEKIAQMDKENMTKIINPPKKKKKQKTKKQKNKKNKKT